MPPFRSSNKFGFRSNNDIIPLQSSGTLYLQTLDAVATSNPSLIKVPNKLLSLASSCTTSFLKGPSKFATCIVTNSVSVLRQPLKSLFVNTVGVLSIKRDPQITLSVIVSTIISRPLIVYRELMVVASSACNLVAARIGAGFVAVATFVVSLSTHVFEFVGPTFLTAKFITRWTLSYFKRYEGRQ